MADIENMRIDSTMLGFEEHGILSSTLYLRSERVGQGFGGYSLGGLDGIGSAAAGLWLARVLKTVGVSKWEDLPGKYVRVERDHSRSTIKKIGHITDDKWFDVGAEMDALEESQ